MCLRYLIVINLLGSSSAYQTAEVQGVHHTTVYRAARCFRNHGAWAFWESREETGQTKLGEYYLWTP